MVSNTDMPAMERLNSVQVMRGVAALLVLFFHINALLPGSGETRSKAIGAFWEQGYAGVDMFFVISGFIMVYVTQTIAPSAASAGRFLYGRISRIFPLWWVFAILMMIYFWMSYQQPAPPDRITSDGVLAYSVKSLLLIPQKFTPVLGTGWTLIHEMLFYILFAAGLMVSRRFLPIWLGLWAAVIIIVSAMGSPTTHAENYWQLLTSPLNLEFIFGAALAYYMARKNAKGSSWFLLLGLAGFSIAMIMGVAGQPTEFLWKRVLVFGLSSMFILYGAIWMERAGRLKFPRFFIRLGDWSYSLYLAHMLVLLTLRRIWTAANGALPGPLKFGAEGIFDNVVFILLATILSVLTAFLSYRLIEQPSLKMLRRKP